MTPSSPALVIGRYRLFDVIGSGGMASVYLARQSGGAGFVRSVAVKRLHPQHTSNAEFATMFLDEAKLASRIRHLNVVETLDVIESGSEILMVMELVEGATLTTLLSGVKAAQTRIPLPIAAAIISGMLRGLHAAHTAVGPMGIPLNIVHRDVSPHNVMIGVDGVARVLDFGVAKANGQAHATRHGEVRGKPAYMAPEHLREGATTLSDIYSAGVVLWEVLANERLFQAESEGGLIARVLEGRVRRLPAFSPPVPSELEAVAMRALAKNPQERFPSAAAMADALERAMPPASPAEVSMAVERWAGRELADLRAALFTIDAEESHPVLPRVGPMVGAVPIPSAPVQPQRYVESVRPGFAPSRGTGEITLTGPSDGSAPAAPRAPMFPPAASRRRFARWPFVLGAGFAGVALGGVLVFGLDRRAASNPAEARAPDEPGLLPSAPSDLAPTAAPSSVETAVVATSSDSWMHVMPPGEQSNAAPVRTTPPAIRTVTSGPVSTQSGAVTSPRPDCDPPWELDQNGVQRVKVRCFKVRP